MRYPHLSARLYNTPLLLHPDKAAVIEGVFQAHMNRIAAEDAFAGVFDRTAETKPQALAGSLRRDERPYQLTEGGVAIIPVMGTLVQRSSWMDAASGMTGYPKIANMLDYALNDPDAKAILLEVDSGGGEASGVFDLADKIYAAREQKPIWAIANEQAYSAAYAIASSAAELYLPRTAGVGSVGVIALHVDQSGKNEKAGMVYSAIHAGAKKNDLSRHAPLSDAARADLQAEIDRLYSLFTDTVARNRGLDAEAVKATEAGLLNPDQAMAAGFADGIATLDDVISRLETAVASKTPDFSTTARPAGLTKEAPMSQNQAPAAGPAEPPIDQTKLRAEGAQSERARIKAIQESEEAKGRSKLAAHIAFSTAMGIEDARAMLAVAPTEAPTAAANPLAAAMAGVTNPKIGAGADSGVAETPEAQATALARQILNAGQPSAA